MYFWGGFKAKSDSFWGGAPDPDGGAYSAPPDPPAGREGCPLPGAAPLSASPYPLPHPHLCPPAPNSWIRHYKRCALISSDFSRASLSRCVLSSAIPRSRCKRFCSLRALALLCYLFFALYAFFFSSYSFEFAFFFSSYSFTFNLLSFLSVLDQFSQLVLQRLLSHFTCPEWSTGTGCHIHRRSACRVRKTV